MKTSVKQMRQNRVSMEDEQIETCGDSNEKKPQKKGGRKRVWAQLPGSRSSNEFGRREEMVLLPIDSAALAVEEGRGRKGGYSL